MKDKASYHNGGAQPLGLPLDLFFTALQRSGIGVTPAQIAEANKLILQYAPSIQDEAALCQYLCPLFATNLAEQERFKEIFAEHFLSTAKEEDLLVGEIPSGKRPTWWKYLLCMLPLLLFAAWLIYRAQQAKTPTINLALTINNSYYGIDGNDLQFATGDSLQALVEAGSDENLHSILNVVYDWGDGTAPDSIGRHVYRNSGIFTTKAMVEISYKGKPVKKDTLEETVSICGFRNDAAITSSAKNDSTPLHKPVQVLLVVNNPSPPKLVEWDIRLEGGSSNTSVSFMRGSYPHLKQYVWTADSVGVYKVSCRILYDSVDNHPCSYTVTKFIYANDPNKPQADATLQANPNAKPLQASYSVRQGWLWLLGGGLLLSMLLGNWLLRRYKRLTKATGGASMLEDDYQQWLASLRSDKPYANMPFLQKNLLAPPEPGMAAIARLMRRRIASDARYLHIVKTVGKAVRNNGMFLPVYEPRTQQSEYLLLIEESHLNSQHTKLFDYVADMMRRYNVLVEKYYYRYEPSLCYNAQTPSGISLEKLSEQYPGHILLIVGHAKQLVYRYQPMVSTAYQTLLARWQHKAVLTPVPLADWGTTEKNILPTVMPVFPADTAGLQLMVEALADNRADVAAGLQEAAKGLYSTDAIDFADIDELADYCSGAAWANHPSGNRYQNLFLQWIAALAVYPKLQWELVLAIGKAILDTAGMGHQLNYTNLLRLARINWMNEGIMPQELRLELLKKLEQPHEVLARETILAMLAEIPANDLRPGHGAYEEKEIQRIINEFNLYAYDPVQYEKYAASKLLLERLWQDDKLMEAPVKKYLRNETVQWPTLINHRLTNSAQKGSNVPLDTYLQPLPPATGAKAKLFKLIGNAMAIVSVVCSLGLVGLLILQLSGSGRWPLLSKQKTRLQDVSFTLIDSTAKRQPREVVVKVDDSAMVLKRTGRLPLTVSDGNRVVAVAVDGKLAFDTFMAVDQDSYRVVVKDKVAQQTSSGLLLTLMAHPDCNKTEAGDRMGNAVAALDSSLWPNIRLLSTNGVRATPNCFSEIRVGKGVDNAAVAGLIARFNEAGFFLTLRPGGIRLENAEQGYNSQTGQNNAGADIPGIYAFRLIRAKAGYNIQYNVSTNDTAYTPGEREVVVSGKATEAKTPQQVPNPNPTPAKKPLIYIQVSDAGMMGSAQKFQRELMAKGYDVKAPELRDWNYNSEIYYFDKGMEKNAQAVQKLYRAIYPAQPLKTNLRKTNNQRPNDNRIVVWIRQLPKPDSDNGFQPTVDYGNRNDMVLGKRIVSIAQKEIGTGEIPPGSGKTKYGEWFDPKRNADGLSWSAIFVSWVYDQAGVPLYIVQAEKGFSSFVNLLQATQSRKYLTDEPQPGDIFILDRVKSSYHGGIFVRWIDKAAGTFETVEGNISIGNNKNGYVDKGVRSSKSQKVYFVHFR